MKYEIPTDLMQAIVNLLQEMPAKASFQVLKAIDDLIQQTPPQVPQGEKNDKGI